MEIRNGFYRPWQALLATTLVALPMIALLVTATLCGPASPPFSPSRPLFSLLLSPPSCSASPPW